MIYLLARGRGRRGVAAVAVGFVVPTAVVALVVGPGQLLYWAVLGNGSYLGVQTLSATVWITFIAMTAAFAGCNLPLLWEAATRVARPCGTHARWREQHRLVALARSAVVSVAVGLRFFGHYYMQLLPPLALLTAGALSKASRKAVAATIAFRDACRCSARSRP